LEANHSRWPGSGLDQGHPASQAPPTQHVPWHCPKSKLEQLCIAVHGYDLEPQGLAPWPVNMECLLGKSVAMGYSTQHQRLPHWLGGVSSGNDELSNPYLSRLVATEQANSTSTATYLPGADNMVADCLSHLWPHHEWKLVPAMFCHLNQCWGPHTIDRTASASNSQLPCFNSQFSEAKREAVDCLLQDWSKENNWAAPPITLIWRILNLIKRQHTMVMINCGWFSHLKWLTINRPVHVPALARNFSSKSRVLLEPLCNKHWRWVAYRISGCPTQQAGHQQQPTC